MPVAVRPEVASASIESVRREYRELVDSGLSLDLTRGKPAPEQLDLAANLQELPGAGQFTIGGVDCRNYGGLEGLPELRTIFSELLQVPAENLVAAGNSSLELMHDCLVHALLSVLPGAQRRWVDEERIAFICPVPGYDRHFALCERFNIEMLPVPMTADGPDMDEVERLAGSDPAVKGIWCVPKYSNPDGTCYSDETVERLARMRTAAPDFRIFWDNAYAVHHLTDEHPEIADVLTACATAGNPDRVFVFGSTSKVTWAGSGVAFFGSSLDNRKWLLGNRSKSSIGPDKMNQLRHVAFLQDADGVRAHMERQRAIIQPKFETVLRILDEELGGTGLAEWTSPKGGYFVLLRVPEGCAKEVVRLAAEAGIVLTPAGATHPYGNDPDDAAIRIAPTYPGVPDVERAIRGLTVCVRLAGYEKALAE